MMTTLPLAQSNSQVQPPESRAWGLATRRMAWRLTWRGWLLVLTFFLVSGWMLKLFAYSFLAPLQPVPSSLLIFEGWSPTSTAKQVADLFHSGHFQKVLVVRALTDSTNIYESGRFAGDYMKNLIVEDGVPQSCVSIIFPLVAKKDRTYHSALAAKQWMMQQGISLKAIDVATLGPHARRSRLLYERAFGDGTQMGIVPLADDQYTAEDWWRTSAGVREVIGESIAYLYARILFRASSS